MIELHVELKKLLSNMEQMNLHLTPGFNMFEQRELKKKQIKIKLFYD